MPRKPKQERRNTSASRPNDSRDCLTRLNQVVPCTNPIYRKRQAYIGCDLCQIFLKNEGKAIPAKP